MPVDATEYAAALRQYAAGVVLFEMLTGHPPYGGDTPLAVAYQHVHLSLIHI